MAATVPPVQAPADPIRPRWGYHVSLWQWGRPAFWLYAVIMLATTFYTLVIQASLISLSPVGWVMSIVLLLLYAVPVFILVYALDLYEREPMSLVVGALLWGIFASFGIAVIANGGWLPVVGSIFGEEWTPAIVAPVTEEIAKGAGVILIYLIAREEIDDVLDGFVYGAMVGLGFTVIEDILYFIQNFGGTPGGVLQGFFFRVVAGGLYTHVLFTALFGMGVAYFVTRRNEATPGKRLLVAGGLILAAMLAHFIWNSPLLYFFPDSLSSPADYLQVVFAMAVKGLPFLAFLILMISLGRRREHRWLRYALQDEVGLQGLHHDELATLENPSLRRKARKRMTAQYGPVAGHTLKRLQKAHIDLAMIRTRTDDPNHPDLVRQRQYCEALRNWLVQNTGHRGSTMAWNVPAAVQQPYAQQPPGQPPGPTPPAGQPPSA